MIRRPGKKRRAEVLRVVLVPTPTPGSAQGLSLAIELLLGWAEGESLPSAESGAGGEKDQGESGREVGRSGAMKAYLEPAEVEALEQATTNQRDRLLVRLLARLGCRISEAVALTVEDIDLEQGTVTIQHLKARLKLSCPECNTRLGRAHAFCPKCGAQVKEAVAASAEHRRRRVLPVDRDTLDMLREYIQRGGPVEKDGKRFLFGISRFRAWQVVSECGARARLPSLVNPETGKVRGVSPHRLRDAFAVHAVKVDDSGDGLRLLQEHLGHVSFNTTARYRKVSGQEHRDWYDRLWGGSPDGNTCGGGKG